MTIRWVTPLLGTAAADAVRDLPDIKLIDVRDLVDKAGNATGVIRQKIDQGVTYLRLGQKTVVCCDYGISRSNALAAGILSSFSGMAFSAAVRRVQEATGETEIKLEPLNAVRAALESGQIMHRKGRSGSILVTGASGFLGAATCLRLEGNFRVIAPSRAQLDLETGSTKLDLLADEHCVESIVHLANPRIYTSNVALGKTLIMLRNVLEVCISRGISLLYPSGWEIYSGYSGRILADEAVPPFPRGPYGEAKYLAEHLIAHCRRTQNLKCAILRSSPVYGPGSDKPKFLYNFIDKALRSEPIVTHRYRNGDPALDLLYIEDFVMAIEATLHRGFVGDLNLGTSKVTSTNEVATMLRTMLGSSSPIEHVQIDADVASIAMDCRKARLAVDWQPTVELEDGLWRLVSAISKAKRGRDGT